MIYFTKVMYEVASARGKRGEGPLSATCAADDGKRCYVFVTPHKSVDRLEQIKQRISDVISALEEFGVEKYYSNLSEDSV